MVLSRAGISARIAATSIISLSPVKRIGARNPLEPMPARFDRSSTERQRAQIPPFDPAEPWRLRREAFAVASRDSLEYNGSASESQSRPGGRATSSDGGARPGGRMRAIVIGIGAVAHYLFACIAGGWARAGRSAIEGTSRGGFSA